MRVAINEKNERFFADEADPQIEYYCPCCNESVIVKNRGNYKAPHFAHKSLGECDNWTNDMSDWHISWQKRFPKECQEVIVEKNGIKHRADVLIGNTVIEFQHSSISEDEFWNRNKFYLKCSKKIIWVFDMRNEFREDKMYYLNNNTCNKFYWKYPLKLFNEFPLYKEQNRIFLFFDFYEDDDLDGTNLNRVVWKTNNFGRFATDECFSNQTFVERIMKKNRLL